MSDSARTSDVPSGTFEFCKRKAFEVSYALSRVAEAASAPDLKSALERSAARLLESVAYKQYVDAEAAVGACHLFVHLGHALGTIGSANAQTLFEELELLNSAIAESKNEGSIAELNLQEVFTSKFVKNEERSKTGKYREETDVAPDVADSARILQNTAGSAIRHLADSASHSEDSKRIAEPLIFSEKARDESESDLPNLIRQSAMLEKVYENGSCKFKDIQEAFPAVSERTIRYDLQKLCEHGLIEKIGSTGPATFYRPIARSEEVGAS